MGSQVQLFVTCLVDALAPQVGRSTLAALESADCDISFPEGQTCCGQPAFNIGLNDRAREMAEHTLDVLDATEGPIVLPSGSCTEMIVHHYKELFVGTDREDQAERVSARTKELSQFLADSDNPPKATCGSCTVAYHYSCHGLRGLGLDETADELLTDVDRVELDGDRECCGFGGLFSVEMPAVSASIMDAKLDRVLASGADILVGSDISCLMHLEGGLRRRGATIEVRHLAELLGDSEDV